MAAEPSLADELQGLVLRARGDAAADLAAARDQHAKRPGCANPIVTLNVGGQMFSTRRSTLQLFPDSLLAKMVSDDWQEGQQRDAQGQLFLDMDPCVFDALLQFLR
jgi:hypothetical protein